MVRIVLYWTSSMLVFQVESPSVMSLCTQNTHLAPFFLRWLAGSSELH